MQKLSKNYLRGFTLVELMVASSIFVTIMILVVGSLAVSSRSAHKAQSLRQAMDNVSFAMENMTRSIRVGDSYQCVASGSTVTLGPGTSNNDCPLGGSGGGAIIFTTSGSSISHDTAFRRFQSPSGSYTLQKCDLSLGCVDVTAPEVNINTLQFFVDGSSTTDDKQPYVYIIMKGTVLVKGELSSFSVQTVAAQRSTE